ncbi:MAG: alanine-glyoxylate transaminase/serine-glyoxylate transaminase/serine-pyruvate transaminase [Planctomycetota bacterium]|jgi:alanine-glyoxylate transaminase/serine-glyoxylate transaminase/serine-pyruvate transaminase
MDNLPSPLAPPRRVLLGPGPSDVAPSVLEALGKPTVGHLDPVFLGIMDEIRAMQRVVFGTKNALTMPISATGSAGMEACLVNLIEPGNRVIVGVNGVFGTRIAEVSRRCGAEVVEVQGEWGRALDPEAIRSAGHAAGLNFDLLCCVHAETSTGVRQEIPPLREVADELGALLLVDCVTSLAGIPVEFDAWGIDAAYSGTQKCLSCPPGLSPISLSDRAAERLSKRTSKVASWYLDLSLLGTYWGAQRAYHHTAPINMLYGLHEALRLTLEEGLEARFKRHALNSHAFWAGLEELGVPPTVPEAERLIPLTAVAVPAGVDEARVRRFLLENYSIEIGAGLGPLKGKVWRVGLMGAGSTRSNVELCLAALKGALESEGHKTLGDPLGAAQAVYQAKAP